MFGHLTWNVKISPINIPRSDMILPGMSKKDTAGLIGGELINSKATINSKRIVLYLHGGAYVVSSPRAHRAISTTLCQLSDTPVLSVDYRLAPDHPFPLALHDAISAYLNLIKSYRPQNVVLAGDSAGAGLCFSLALWLRDNSYDLPGGIVAIAPWVRSFY